MPVKRSYAEHGDACATAHGMELIGEKWTHPILRELMLGPKRFGALEASVRGITPAVLSARLRELEASGLVRRVTLPPPARATAYDLTPWARELRPIFRTLAHWAHRSPTWHPESGGLTPDGIVESMLTMAPPVALDPPVVLALRLRDDREPAAETYDYRLTWGDALDITRSPAPDAAATVTGDSTTWTGVLYSGVALAAMTVTGDAAEVHRLVAAFAPA